jgi:two-component system, NarL family, response regulator LiaR
MEIQGKRCIPLDFSRLYVAHMSVRFLLVDDHDVMRMGLRTLLAVKDDWQVCGEAADGNAALEKVSELSPDAVILDLVMPGMTGFEIAAKIRQIAPSTKIIFFSLHNVPITARESGGDAFVSKASGAQELLATIECLVSPRAAGLTDRISPANRRFQEPL